MVSDQLLLGVLNFGLLAVPVERAQAKLRDAALRDPLTGCWKRAGFARFSAKFATEGAAAIAIEIDHFKQLNDRFGHAEGDQALVALVAAALQLARPLRGEVARLGGDEFAVLLPVASELEARKFATDLKAELPARDGSPAWTISVGFSSASLGSPDCSDALKQADASLYRAKWARRERDVA